MDGNGRKKPLKEENANVFLMPRKSLGAVEVITLIVKKKQNAYCAHFGTNEYLVYI